LGTAGQVEDYDAVNGSMVDCSNAAQQGQRDCNAGAVATPDHADIRSGEEMSMIACFLPMSSEPKMTATSGVRSVGVWEQLLSKPRAFRYEGQTVLPGKIPMSVQ
jgi:hypothetical protein